MTRTLLFTIATCTTMFSWAQEVDQLLKEINARYQGSVKFRIDKDDRLIADLFDQSGHFRQDAVYLEFLDPVTFRYSPEEDAVIMGCQEEHPGCVEKEVFKMNVIRHSGRSVLPAPAGDPEATATLSDLAELVSLVHVRQELARSETHPRPERKK
ncbi:MAG: hypothetical protein KDB88_08415 [Flavobacteriales bacterium]|nr:hypothetical protein [Flavobacteriales bacterium]